MPEPIAIGFEDFLEIRQTGAAYVDRSAAIAELLAARNKISIICRPRRFGKSLLLSTLRAYLERGTDHSQYFEDLAIWGDPAARAHFAQYPVIHLSLKALTGPTLSSCVASMALSLSQELQRQVERWPGLEASPDPNLRRLLQREPNPDDMRRLLLALSTELHRLSGQRVVVLLDEYDTPLHRAQEHGFYPEMIDLLRDMLDLGLKSNPCLAFAVVTGVLRVSREGLWSSFNNPSIYTVLDPELSGICGFTEGDVAQLLERTGSELPLSDIQRWYNGYLFGGQVMYSPWSVLQAIARKVLRPWWARSGSADRLSSLLRQAGPHLQSRLLVWMEGRSQTAVISDSLLLREDRPEDVLSMLVHGGYLTAASGHVEGDDGFVELRVPNQDVLISFRDCLRSWLLDMPLDQEVFFAFKRSLLKGEPSLEEQLHLLLSAASTHDFPYPDHERGYHVFLLGLLAWLRPEYRVISNQEAGLGRADILILPSQSGGTGVVIEIKRARSARQASSLVKAALQQAADRRYDQRLREVGVGRLVLWGLVFWGKECRVAVEVEEGSLHRH